VVGGGGLSTISRCRAVVRLKLPQRSATAVPMNGRRVGKGGWSCLGVEFTRVGPWGKETGGGRKPFYVFYYMCVLRNAWTVNVRNQLGFSTTENWFFLK